MNEWVYLASQSTFTLLVGLSMAGLGIMAGFIVYMLIQELKRGSIW